VACVQTVQWYVPAAKAVKTARTSVRIVKKSVPTVWTNSVPPAISAVNARTIFSVRTAISAATVCRSVRTAVSFVSTVRKMSARIVASVPAASTSSVLIAASASIVPILCVVTVIIAATVRKTSASTAVSIALTAQISARSASNVKTVWTSVPTAICARSAVQR